MRNATLALALVLGAAFAAPAFADARADALKKCEAQKDAKMKDECVKKANVKK